MIQPAQRPGSRFAFSSVTVLFFLWGFITCMNDLLILKFKADFALTQFQANLVQSAFFWCLFSRFPRLFPDLRRLQVHLAARIQAGRQSRGGHPQNAEAGHRVLTNLCSE